LPDYLKTHNALLSGKLRLAKMREVRAAANCNFSDFNSLLAALWFKNTQITTNAKIKFVAVRAKKHRTT